MALRFGTREHRGGLDESLATSKYFDEKRFNELLPYYEYYAFDERCNQIMFILKDMEHEWRNHPVWLFIEIK